MISVARGIATVTARIVSVVATVTARITREMGLLFCIRQRQLMRRATRGKRKTTHRSPVLAREMALLFCIRGRQLMRRATRGKRKTTHRSPVLARGSATVTARIVSVVATVTARITREMGLLFCIRQRQLMRRATRGKGKQT